MYRQPGEQTLLRLRRLGPPGFVCPATVVEDGPERTILFLAAGTPIKMRKRPDGSPFPRHIPFAEQLATPRVIGDGVWSRNHVLRFLRPGDAYDISLFWSAEDWTFRQWYVNLQAPFRRVPVGFDTADHVLDLVAGSDLNWQWKDEDELEAAVEVGRFTAEEAAAIRAEGERAIARSKAGEWPFDADYETWRPDPSWSIPTMPDNWSED